MRWAGVARSRPLFSASATAHGERLRAAMWVHHQVNSYQYFTLLVTAMLILGNGSTLAGDRNFRRL
jgi:hypothetical protein